MNVDAGSQQVFVDHTTATACVDQATTGCVPDVDHTTATGCVPDVGVQGVGLARGWR